MLRVFKSAQWYWSNPPKSRMVFFNDEAWCKGVIQGLDWPQAAGGFST